MKAKRILSLVLCVVICLGLCACGKSQSVRAVETAIDRIGTVSLDSEDLIVEAEELYDGLTEKEQGQVSNYDVLIDARDRYDDLAVRHVEGLIDDIGTVTIASGDEIDAARLAFDALDSGVAERVDNIDVLIEAEELYAAFKKLEANQINYKSISAAKANAFDATLKTWYTDLDAAATLFICFYFEGYANGSVKADKLHLGDQHVAINEADGRVDIYAPYGNNGQIMGMRYWPSKGTAQIGTVSTDMDIDEYLDLLVECGVITQYKDIPFSNISKIISLLG